MLLDYGLLLMRIVIGLVIAAHGAQKAFGWFGGNGITGATKMVESLNIRPASFWATVAAINELVGGLLLLFGLLMPIGPMMIVANMLAAIWYVHWKNGLWNANRGYEFPLVLGAQSLALALTGPGAYALDPLLRIAMPEPVTLIVLIVIVILGFIASNLTGHWLGRVGRQAAA